MERGGAKIKGQCALLSFFHCLLWHVLDQLDATHTFDQTLIIQLAALSVFRDIMERCCWVKLGLVRGPAHAKSRLRSGLARPRRSS